MPLFMHFLMFGWCKIISLQSHKLFLDQISMRMTLMLAVTATHMILTSVSPLCFMSPCLSTNYQLQTTPTTTHLGRSFKISIQCLRLLGYFAL